MHILIGIHHIVVDTYLSRLLCNKKRNKLKYNFSRSVYLIQGADASAINIKCRFLNVQRFDLSRGNFSHGRRELV